MSDGIPGGGTVHHSLLVGQFQVSSWAHLKFLLHVPVLSSGAMLAPLWVGVTRTSHAGWD